MQTFSRTRALPPYFPQLPREADVGGVGTHEQSPNVVTMATALEVATVF